MKLEELEPVVMFAVPPLDPRVKLYIGRVCGREVHLQGYTDRAGAQYASFAAYFGSLLFELPGCEGVFESVAGCLHGGGDPEPVLRADYAYDGASGRYLLLRAGFCEQIPEPHDTLPDDAVRLIEDAIAAHMGRPAIEAKLGRSERYASDAALFEGEGSFLEGLVGFGAVPVPIKCGLADVPGLGIGAVGLSERHDAELLRGIVRDFCCWAYGEGSLYARMHEHLLFGSAEGDVQESAGE